MKTKLALLFFALSGSIPVLAQPCPPGCPAIVPIDGGISFLVAAGVAYGAKKVYDAKKKTE